jgi:YD repeat-containing protein
MLFLYGYPEILQIWETAGNTVSYPCQNLWWGIKIQANSLAPLGTSAGGNHVGYSQVTVRDVDMSNQDNGRTIYEYINIPDSPPTSRVFPEIATAWNGSNGMLLKETVLNKTGLKVKEVLNDTPIKNPLFSNIYKGFKYFIGDQLLPPPFDQIHNPVVTKSEYSIPSDFWYSPKSKQRVYDVSDPTNTKFVETEIETVYGSPEHLQPTAQKSFDSKNRLLETIMLYPHDMVSLNRDPQGTYDDMVTSNIISPVIEQVQKINGLQIGLTQKNYSTWVSTLDPFSFFAPISVKTQKGASEELVTKITFNNYTSDGKPILYTELNGITTSLEYWDNTDINKKNLVKTKIVGTGPTAQTTTYDYFPLIGIKETVQPNGIKMTYKYDDFNRLENIRDTNGKLIKSNTYNYKGQQ